ncbi:transcriptional regulator [Halogeometricum sp. wsp3]|nr:transcriptional regulator [Halogeometricum sp. wsp3]
MGSQWRLIVLHDLQDGEKRFNELKRSTDVELADSLARPRRPPRDGHVERRLEEDAPVATYYSLTAKGESLCPVFDELEKWSKKWLAGCE